MERNLNCGIAISKWFSRALYSDVSGMAGVCVDGHAHLAQNTSDLEKIAMRMSGEHIEIATFIFLFVEVCVQRERVRWLVGEEGGFCGGFGVLVSLGVKGGFGC